MHTGAMRWQLDKQACALYVQWGDGPSESQRCLDGSVIIDLSGTADVLGIEFLDLGALPEASDSVRPMLNDDQAGDLDFIVRTMVEASTASAGRPMRNLAALS